MFSELPEIIEEFSTNTVDFDRAYLALDSGLDNMID
jgi:hypothetical protein